jgi:hypothetical protein
MTYDTACGLDTKATKGHEAHEELKKSCLLVGLVSFVLFVIGRGLVQEGV